MSSLEDAAAEQGPESMEPIPAETDANTAHIIIVTVGATVPTGFEHTAAEEVKEKIGVDVHISKDRGRIYFPITTDKLFQVLKSNASLKRTRCTVVESPQDSFDQVYFLRTEYRSFLP